MKTIATIAAEQKAEHLHPEWGTTPRVYYLGLPKTFLAGKVIDVTTGAYLEGATVSITSSSTGRTDVRHVDNYGDFEFDGLENNTTWNVTVEMEGYRQLTLEGVHLTTDTDLGKIRLAKTS
jgi:hypothetical protein